jgi:hypothetical protein
METTEKPPTGRERRRKGPVNAVRRFLYGMLLLAAAPGATAAADQLASIGKFRAHTAPPAPARAALATLQGLLVLRARSDGGPDVALDAVTAQVPQQGSAAAPQFQVSADRKDRSDSVVFDLPLSELGAFRLHLHTERTAALSAWSLAGTLEATLEPDHRHAVAAVPTLRINDMFGSETRYLAFEGSVRRGADDEPQLVFNWRI